MARLGRTESRIVSPPGLNGHDHGVGPVALADRQRILTSHGEVDELPSLRLQSLLSERIQSSGLGAMVQPLRGDDLFPRCGDGDTVAIARAHPVAGNLIAFGVFLRGRPDRIGND